MSTRKYTAVLEPEDEGGYSVYFPTLPGCVTQGETREEALRNAQEVLNLHIEGLLAEGLEVPEEHEAPELAVLSLSA
jgi:predicted RNase H-like HicB family nuclease